jgi:hypothetical protein
MRHLPRARPPLPFLLLLGLAFGCPDPASAQVFVARPAGPGWGYASLRASTGVGFSYQAGYAGTVQGAAYGPRTSYGGYYPGAFAGYPWGYGPGWNGGMGYWSAASPAYGYGYPGYGFGSSGYGMMGGYPVGPLGVPVYGPAPGYWRYR